MAQARKGFSSEVAERLGHYVYRLIDPRTGVTFYVGKGVGSRVFAHAAGDLPDAEEGEPAKLRIIREIQTAGFEVAHVIHRHGLDSATAYEVEAALMDAYPGLTNSAGGHGSGERGAMHAEEIRRVYEAEEAAFLHRVIIINVNQTSTEHDLYDAVRYAWKISRKSAAEAEYVLAARRGIILDAFVVERWEPASREHFPGFEPVSGRLGFIGTVAPEPIRRLYRQKRVPDDLRKKGSANPIRYTGPQ